MPAYTDALRGYARHVLERDSFTCRYCGLDGRESFANWAALSWDHLLPKGNARRDDPDYIVAACQFCNAADNRYFDLAAQRGITFDGLSVEQLVAQRRTWVERTRDDYRVFWESNVRRSKQGEDSIAPVPDSP